ncbi:cyclic pyranopterin monophosphate synthase MoaC [Neolewinella antarctica]|uniref:cyclic pyranopterin monophosphate synthase n=1 Tax=Neolewinella antarctica TaxID=442734 RepID=A0ABX0X7E2_9BACT|nr:cyclic pyranopterin monophosphate synthase MoaC [Neolewinella antarctica]NJC24965.1 cyclic pyranopterin phosphate synthase [Neolewinella antarctica]
MSLTHLDSDGRPTMVDVGDKVITTRVAVAHATVVLGKKIMAELSDNGFNSKKGSVVHTAIIAGTQAVKQTWSVIPLCHAIAISSCKIKVEGEDAGAMLVECRVRTEGRTGVEMEALHGAAVAALTIYDMCKAMSHDIRIENIHLVSKTGGKSDYQAPEV